MVNVTDNSVRREYRINSFFDVFTELSINGSPSKASRCSQFILRCLYGNRRGESSGLTPPSLSTVIPRTDIQARIRAVDQSGNVTLLPYGNITIVPRRPILKPFFPAPFKKQSTFEINWFGAASNSWCGPTAASSCLQRLGVPASRTTRMPS